MHGTSTELETDPGVPAPRLGKRARTRRTLLDAAGRIFDRDGVEHATVEDIADAAGVSVGTVYSHFGSKEALALAFIDEAFSVMETYLAEARTAESPLERVLAAGDAYVRFVVEHQTACRHGQARAYLPPQAHTDELARAINERVKNALLLVAVDLKTSMDEGEIPVIPLDEAVIFVSSAWLGMGSMLIRTDSLAIPLEAAERALSRGRRMLLAALTIDPLPEDPVAPWRPPGPRQN